MAAVLNPAEVERWLHGLGSLLPREAVSALANEVRRGGMDSEAFDELVASRLTPALGDSVRPAHMATLRRCWRAEYRGPRADSTQTPSSQAETTKPRPDKLEAVSESRPLHPPATASSSSNLRFAPPLRVETTLRPNEDAEDEDISPGLPLAEPQSLTSKVQRPAQVPRLDLSFIHRKAGQKGDDADELVRHNWKHASRPSSKNGSAVYRHVSSSSKEPTKRVGFAWASSEDQQRIAEFYGYRDEGFVATMSGLRTDMIRPRLYIGNMADAAYWPLIKAFGITHVVNCAVEAQKAPPPYESHDIKYLLLPFHDSIDEAQSLPKHKFRSLRSATKYVQSVLKGRGNENNAVLVHCVQGLSRSAAVVCSYLMEYEGLAADRALTEVKTKHPGCLTSQHWQVMLQKFNAELLRGF